MILVSLAIMWTISSRWISPLVVYFLIDQILLGRFPCCFKFCGSHGGTSYIYLSKQWMGNQYPDFRPVSKYSSPLCNFRFWEYHHVKYKFYLAFYSSAGDGVVVRGQAYGVRSIRVDGNDALAMYSAVNAARQMAISEHRPILVEVTYKREQQKNIPLPLLFLVPFLCS